MTHIHKSVLHTIACVLSGLLAAAPAKGAINKSADQASGPSPKSTKPSTPIGSALRTMPKELKSLLVEDTIVGQGKIAIRGKTIKVNYSGWLYDPATSTGRGKPVDTSVGGEPFIFTLGEGKVIKGWESGFENMRVGGKRKLLIPAELAYGAAGAGTVIPPHAPLMFEVELLEVL